MLEYREGPVRSNWLEALRDFVAHFNRSVREYNEAALARIGWSRIEATPTTLDGYGITDAARSNHRHHVSDIDGLPDVADEGTAAVRFADILDKPTTIDGYGLTDASRVGHTHPWGEIHSRPSTLAGYGITDASPLGHNHDAHNDARYAGIVHIHDDRYYTRAEIDAFGVPRIPIHDNVIATDYTLPSSKNGILAGPVATAAGVTLTIEPGATLVTV